MKRDHAMKGAPVVIALSGQLDELGDMLGGLICGKLEPEHAGIGGDDGFHVARRKRRRLGQGRAAESRECEEQEN